MGQVKNVYLNGLDHFLFFFTQLPGGDGAFSRNKFAPAV